jgi:hypothetical protein
LILLGVLHLVGVDVDRKTFPEVLFIEKVQTDAGTRPFLSAEMADDVPDSQYRVTIPNLNPALDEPFPRDRANLCLATSTVVF